MADIIKCPVCGESNLSDQEYCQYCRSRLEPLTGPLKGADAPIKPGQIPTKKNTAELEPILPQWLREARDSARKSADNDLSREDKPKPESFPASSSDLLAGLHSQKEDAAEEDEIPDWLASITGDSPKSKKGQTESPEVRWVELGGAKDFATEEPPKAESTKASRLPEDASAKSQTSDDSDLNDWFKSASNIQTPQQPEPIPVPDNSFSASSSEESTPDWLRQMAVDADESQQPEKTPSFIDDSPDWLRNLSTTSEVQNIPAKAEEPKSDEASLPDEEPDWLRAMGGLPTQPQSADPVNLPETSSGMFDAAESQSAEIPSWMQSLPPVEDEKQDSVPQWLREEKPASAEAVVPSWLSGLPAMEPAVSETEQAPAEESSKFGDIPDWLKAAAPQSSIFPDHVEEPVPAPPSELSDWFDITDTPASQSAPAFASDENNSSAPAFVNVPSNENIDSLFTDMPDWLSSAKENTTSNQAPFVNADAIAPGELPSWIEAMRPINAGGSSGSTGGQTLESRGALAGLQGVLPAVPGYTASSKPKAYSIKLQASEEQQGHAALLEQILAAEAEPVPLTSFSTLRASRSLRWVITFIFGLILTPVILFGTQIFAMPAGVPREVSSAVQAAQSIPEGAPVLVAFDYQPARAAEMESAAAPIFGLLRSPSLTFISTTETGGILADRFISGTLNGLTSSSGFSSLNLGYLPGGQMGIRSFAQDLFGTAPLDVQLNPTSSSPQLEGITSLSQFAAIIIVTDSASSARSWIEQIRLAQVTAPVVVISSAQAAPMIQPYYNSGQVSGLVAGIYGGAVVEQNNGGTARRYWDAYSIGMLLAMALVLFGGLWNFVLNLRERTTSREAK